MRERLKEVRRSKGLTQKEVAELLGISEISYQQIENGLRIGRIETWDKLEDLFSIHQRKLREESPQTNSSNETSSNSEI